MSTLAGFLPGAIDGWLRCVACGTNVLFSEALQGCPRCSTTVSVVSHDHDHDPVHEAPAQQFIPSSLAERLCGTDSPINKVCPRLFIGDYRGASDESALSKLAVDSIVNAASLQVPCAYPNKILYLCIPIYDQVNASIDEHLRPAAAWIHDRIINGHNVLVHCVQGISRSATIILAYLMLYREMSLAEALTLLKSCRGVIKPNVSFMAALSGLE